MHDVFISYSSKNVAVADAICHRLEATGIRCWYAPRNIPGGDEWAGSIIAAIREARIFVLIYSQDSNQSKQVLREVSAAVSAGCTIIPFRLDASNMGDSLSYYLHALHWLDALTPPLEQNIEALLLRARAILSVDGAAPPPPPPPPPTKPRKKKWIPLLATALAAVLILGGAGLAALLQNSKPPAAVDTVSPDTTAAEPVAQVPVLRLTDISDYPLYRYPFYGFQMFSIYRDSYFMENKETGTLSLAKTSSSFTVLENIENIFSDYASLNAVSPDHYNTIYVLDLKAGIVYLYDKGEGRWLFREGIRLGISPHETITVGNVFLDTMSDHAAHRDEMVVMVYDDREEYSCLTRAFLISPDGSVQERDISQYHLTEQVCTFDRSGTEALYTDRYNQVVLFDFFTGEPVDVSTQTLMETYMPRKIASCKVFSPSGRYLMSKQAQGRNQLVRVWDLVQGKLIFSQLFVVNSDTYFQSDRELVYYNQEDCSLHVLDLETGKTYVSLDRAYFEGCIAFQTYPFGFHYDAKLQVYFFCTYWQDPTSGKEQLSLIVTDMDGRVLAQSEAFPSPYAQGYQDLQVTEDTVLMSISPEDPTIATDDGILTHIYMLHYHYDSEGNLIFTE